MKGRKKGLQRKTAPKMEVHTDVLRELALLDWTRCGPELNPMVARYYLGSGFPVRKKHLMEVFAQQATQAFESLDHAFFTRVGDSLARVKSFRAGDAYDPRSFVLMREYSSLCGELYRRGLTERDPAVIAEEEQFLAKKDYVSFADHIEKFRPPSTSRSIPSVSELIARCEKDPTWPKCGDQKKYMYELLKKLGLPYFGRPAGRPKSKPAQK